MQLKKDKISIITPCYNTAHLVPKLLESVLIQDYPNVHMVIMDDGSQDNLKEVFQIYKPRFDERGYELEYYYQINSGQSAAINNSLKLIKGEFFAWPDSDDFYSTDKALSKMIMKLKQADKNVAMVRCALSFVNESSYEEIYSMGTQLPELCERKQLFHDCMMAENDFYFPPGGYIVKTKELLTTIGNNGIFVEQNAGQNWQLMLPILYNYDCITIPEVLHKVLVRSNSHSRGLFKGYEREILKNQTYEATLLDTLSRIPHMPETERLRYINEIKKKYYRLHMILAYESRKRKDYIRLYKAWDKYVMGNKSNKEKAKYLSVILHIEKLVEIYFHGFNYPNL